MLITLFSTIVNQSVKHCTFAGMKKTLLVFCREGLGLTGIEKVFPQKKNGFIGNSAKRG